MKKKGLHGLGIGKTFSVLLFLTAFFFGQFSQLAEPISFFFRASRIYVRNAPVPNRPLSGNSYSKIKMPKKSSFSRSIGYQNEKVVAGFQQLIKRFLFPFFSLLGASCVAVRIKETFLTKQQLSKSCE